MEIKYIYLHQNYSSDYDYLPTSFGNGLKPHYEFIYPLSKRVALDRERLVYKLKEANITSDICSILGVVFIPVLSNKNSQIVDYIPSKKNVRFVNVYLSEEVFNSKNDEEKRRLILYRLFEAILLIVNCENRNVIERIIDDIYTYEEETECVLLSKQTKRYDVCVRFKSSFEKRYTAVIYIKDSITGMNFKKTIFENKNFSELEYRINRISIAKNKCIIYPSKNGCFNYEPIIIQLEI